MTTILMIGSVSDATLPLPFQELAVAAERTVRQSIEKQGCTVRFVDTASTPFPQVSDALAGTHGLVLLGGGDIDPTLYGLAADHPGIYGVDRDIDDFTIGIVRAARDLSIPILGICRGAQILNVAHGGTLIPDITEWAPHHGADVENMFVPERVTLMAQSRIARIYGSTDLIVQSGHHQAIDTVAEGFTITGRAVDGIVEAIESSNPAEWIVGIQWHPEHADADPAACDRVFEAFTRQTHRILMGVSR